MVLDPINSFSQLYHVVPKYKGKQFLQCKREIFSLHNKLYFLFSAKVVSLALFFNEYGK